MHEQAGRKPLESLEMCVIAALLCQHFTKYHSFYRLPDGFGENDLIEDDPIEDDPIDDDPIEEEEVQGQDLINGHNYKILTSRCRDGDGRGSF
jgi:hypothetical protein